MCGGNWPEPGCRSALGHQLDEGARRGSGRARVWQGVGLAGRGCVQGTGRRGVRMVVREPTTRAVRRQAGMVLALLGAVIVAVAALTTPWRALPPDAPYVAPDPARDFTAAQIARAASFDAAISTPAYLSLGLTLLFAGLLAFTPLGARLLGVLRGPWWVRAVLGVLMLTALVEALRWPLGLWYESLLRDYGLSTQNWPGWTVDRLKSVGVGVVLTAIMVVAVIALARRFRRWWIPAAAGAALLTVAASFVYPLLFEPLFNTFTPMPPGELRTSLMELADRDGVHVEDVLVADASRRTTTVNAYVSGFGATRRLVVYDTLLKAPPAEVELVVAHELGHTSSGDVLQGTLTGALGAAFGAVLLYWAVLAVRRRAGLPDQGPPTTRPRRSAAPPPGED